MDNVPIYIVGTSRSGTTLTKRILNSHSAIFIPAGTDFLQDVYSRRGEIGDPATDEAARAAITERLRTLYARSGRSQDDQRRVDDVLTQRGLAERLSAARSYGDAFDIFMTSQMEWEGKRRWGNTQEHDVFELRRVFDFFPNARVIVCTRHVLDFLASYRDAWMMAARKSNPVSARRFRQLYHPIITSLLWRGSMRSAIAGFERWGNHMFLNRYEDLVREPQRQVRRLMDFIGEDFEPDMLEINFNNSSREISESGIFSSSVGRWREVLPDSDAQVAQWICRAELRRLGYESEKVSAGVCATARHLLTAPVVAGRALAANRNRVGPIVPFLLKRIAAVMPSVRKRR